MATTRLHVIYVGDEDDGGAPDFDGYVGWLFEGPSWKGLGEYGVGEARLVDSARVPVPRFFRDAVPAVADGRPLGTVDDFEGYAAGWMAAATAEDAYLFFLPRGYDVSLATEGTYVYRTCGDALAYHRFAASRTPYAVIGGCEAARTGFIVSHELAELATDPVVGQGWFSPEDLSRSGGEIADLCKDRGPFVRENRQIARLWSESAGACSPP
jgi:hypothetical protein